MLTAPKKPIRLQVPGNTRWWAKYHAMCKMWHVKKAVVAVTSEEDFGVQPLKPKGWNSMASLIDTMGPIAEILYHFETAETAALYMLRWIV